MRIEGKRRRGRSEERNERKRSETEKYQKGEEKERDGENDRADRDEAKVCTRARIHRELWQQPSTRVRTLVTVFSNTMHCAAWRGHGVWPVPSSSFFLLDSGARSYRVSSSLSLSLSLSYSSHRPMHRHRSLHRFLPFSPVLLATISTSARLDIDIYRRMPPVEYLLAEPDGTPPEDTHPLPSLTSSRILLSHPR